MEADIQNYTSSYDRIGQMHQVSGLFFAHHIDVREARTYTKRDTKVSVGIYRIVHQPPYLRDGLPGPLDDELKKQLGQELKALTSRQETLEQIVKRRSTRPLDKQWKVHNVKVDAETNKSYSVIVVTGEEKIGFLYFFSGILAELGFNIEMSKCSGLGGQITNRFYVPHIASPDSVRRRIMEKLK